MISSISRISTGYIKYKLSLDEADRLLDGEIDQEELEYLENEAEKLSSSYLENLDQAEQYLDQPHTIVFIATMILTPKSFERLAYSQKLEEHDF